MLLRFRYSRKGALSRYATYRYLVARIEAWKALQRPLAILISLFCIIVSSPKLMHTLTWLDAVEMAEAGFWFHVRQLLLACAVLEKMRHLAISIRSRLIPILVAQYPLPIPEVLHRWPMSFAIDVITSWDFTHGERKVQHRQRLMITQELAILCMTTSYSISHHRWISIINSIVFLLRL